MFPFESVAYAQAGGAEANPFVSFVPLILIVVVFWFFLIRPQQKRQKEHQKMISELGKGDRIVTTGGLFGTITKIGEDRMTVEIADKVRVQIERGQVSRLDKEAADKSKDDSDDEKESLPKGVTKGLSLIHISEPTRPS